MPPQRVARYSHTRNFRTWLLEVEKISAAIGIVAKESAAYSRKAIPCLTLALWADMAWLLG